MPGGTQARSASEGRRRLFEELALPVLDDLYRFACRLERDPDRAADLLQEALLTGFRKFSQLERADSFRAWASTILRRTYFNRTRRRPLTWPLDEAPAEDREAITQGDLQPDERLMARRLAAELKAALDELPVEQRLAVFLVDVGGFTYAEASAILETPPGTVASRVARGRAGLRVQLHHLARERGWIR